MYFILLVLKVIYNIFIENKNLSVNIKFKFKKQNMTKSFITTQDMINVNSCDFAVDIPQQLQCKLNIIAILINIAVFRQMFQDDEQKFSNIELGMVFWPTGDIYFGKLQIKTNSYEKYR